MLPRVETIVAWSVIIGYPLFLIVPPVLHFLIAKPGITKATRVMFLGGLLMFASVFVPIFGMSHELFFIAWLFVIPILLVVDAIIWLISAFRKKNFMIGAVMTGITVLTSGILLGNWVSILGAVLFLAVLVGFRRELK